MAEFHTEERRKIRSMLLTDCDNKILEVFHEFSKV